MAGSNDALKRLTLPFKELDPSNSGSRLSTRSDLLPWMARVKSLTSVSLRYRLWRVKN